MNGAKCEIPLAICADLYGCPNRCAHCWIGHMPNLPMAPDADERIMEKFRPYFNAIEFYSWLREPDFCADYRARWERDKRLSVNCVPERFELASFWRLVRDPEYVKFLKEVGVPCVQLTFFGMEETTDRYIGRKGAFRELLRATEILLENGILPRWQGVRLWQIADVLGISDSNFSRKLRHELGGREKAKIIKIIDRIADAERND